jgi:hypothetical protein
VPSVESCDALGFVLFRYTCLVECGVTGVLEVGFGETFVVVYSAVPYELDLRDARYSFEIWVQD